MKHTDWLRLQTEGENICSRLRQQDFIPGAEFEVLFDVPSEEEG